MASDLQAILKKISNDASWSSTKSIFHRVNNSGKYSVWAVNVRSLKCPLESFTHKKSLKEVDERENYVIVLD